MTATLSPVSPPSNAPDSEAFRAGVEAAQHWWRNFIINTAFEAAGGERGMAACRRNGRCEREPQQSLETLIEAATLAECRAGPATTNLRPPTTAILALLADLARTPDFTAIHLKRPQLNVLLAGVRAMQDQARAAISSIDSLGHLNYTDLNANEIGPAITFLAMTRDSLRELLK